MEIRELCRQLSGVKTDWLFTEAFLNQEPRLDQAVENLREKGCTEIRVLPLLVFKGKHTLEDIPNQVAALRLKYPDVNLELELYLSRLAGFNEMLLHTLQKKNIQSGKE